LDLKNQIFLWLEKFFYTEFFFHLLNYK
jgi:hypothetical protein